MFFSSPSPRALPNLKGDVRVVTSCCTPLCSCSMLGDNLPSAPLWLPTEEEEEVARRGNRGEPDGDAYGELYGEFDGENVS